MFWSGARSVGSGCCSGQVLPSQAIRANVISSTSPDSAFTKDSWRRDKDDASCALIPASNSSTTPVSNRTGSSRETTGTFAYAELAVSVEWRSQQLLQSPPVFLIKAGPCCQSAVLVGDEPHVEGPPPLIPDVKNGSRRLFVFHQLRRYGKLGMHAKVEPSIFLSDSAFEGLHLHRRNQ